MIIINKKGIQESELSPILSRIKEEGLETPFAEIVFDIHLTPLKDGEDNQIVERPRLVG